MNTWQTQQAVQRVFTLPRCDVALYEDAGSGVLGSLVWTARNLENVRISESFVPYEEWLTGQPYPRIRHLHSRHGIALDGVWDVNLGLRRNTQYVLAITWLDASLSASPQGWIRRYYHRVTTGDHEIASRDSNEFTGGLTLQAQYYIETSDGDDTQSGGTWTTPETGANTPEVIGSGTETC